MEPRFENIEIRHKDSLPPGFPSDIGFHSLRATANTTPPKILHPPLPEIRPSRSRAIKIWSAVGLLGGAVLATALVRLNPDLTQLKWHLEADIVSGTPRTKTTQTGKAERWNRRTVEVAIDASVDQLHPQAREAVQRAFGTWLSVGAELPELNFASAKGLHASQLPDGINSVVVAPIEIPGHENDLAVTIGFADPSTGELVEADIVINARHPFAILSEDGRSTTPPAAIPSGDDDPPEAQEPEDGETTPLHADRGLLERSINQDSQITASCTGNTEQPRRCGGTYDLENVMTHEVGHFFGLGEDTEDATATMFQCTSPCETHKRAPQDDDISAMRVTYAGGFPEDPEEIGCSLTDEHRPTPNSVAYRFGFAGILISALMLKRRNGSDRQSKTRNHQ